MFVKTLGQYWIDFLCFSWKLQCKYKFLWCIVQLPFPWLITFDISFSRIYQTQVLFLNAHFSLKTTKLPLGFYNLIKVKQFQHLIFEDILFKGFKMIILSFYYCYKHTYLSAVIEKLQINIYTKNNISCWSCPFIIYFEINEENYNIRIRQIFFYRSSYILKQLKTLLLNIIYLYSLYLMDWYLKCYDDNE